MYIYLFLPTEKTCSQKNKIYPNKHPSKSEQQPTRGKSNHQPPKNHTIFCGVIHPQNKWPSGALDPRGCSPQSLAP